MPRYLRITPHHSRPLKRTPRTPPKLYGCEVGCFGFWQIHLPSTSLIAIRLGQPKTKTTFRNLKGKTAIFRIIGKPTQIGILFVIGGLSVFEIGVICYHHNPPTHFIEKYLGCFLRFFKSCFHNFTLLSKNNLIFGCFCK